MAEPVQPESNTPSLLTSAAEVELKPNGSSNGKAGGFEDSFMETEVTRDTSHLVLKRSEKRENRFSDDFSNSNTEVSTTEKVKEEKSSTSTTDCHVTTGDASTNQSMNSTPSDKTEPPPPPPPPAAAAAGAQAAVVELEPAQKPAPNKKWENFEDKAVAGSRRRSGREKSVEPDKEDSEGPVVAVDANTSQTQYTALSDSIGHKKQAQVTESYFSPAESLPFRRTQSLRADTHRAVRIVDSLRQRRLSNTSLDREPGVLINEDELTRNYKLEREWQLYLKLRRKIPGTKTKWLPVKVSVKDGVLFVKKGAHVDGERRETHPPVQEFILQHNHTVTNPVPRVYERRSKLHQIKLQQTQVRERRTLKRFLFVEHVAQAHTLVKLGTRDLSLVQSVSDAIGEAVRQLPVTRTPGVAYRMNEVFIDVKEHTEILMNCDGAVLDRKSLNRIYIQAFLTGAPECQLSLNDVESTLLQGKGILSQSMTRQVRLCNVVLHPCINKDAYRTAREIRFQPVDGYSFELLRCAIEPHVSPPLTLSCIMEYSPAHHSVNITSSFIVRKKHNLSQRPITNLSIKFPIPAGWASLFLTEKFGQQKTVGSRSSLRGSFRRKIRSQGCQIETQLGTAKYEPEHSAVMWRIGTYTRTSTPHNFTCSVNLKPGMQKPDTQNEFAEVLYNVPGSSTGLTVKEFKTDMSTPESWVKYDIQYHYRVQMFPDLSID